MKELNLKQMESVNGGLESDCKGALVSLGMGVAGVVLSAASLGSGPVGWVSGLSYGLSLAGTSFSGKMCIRDSSIIVQIVKCCVSPYLDISEVVR